VVLPICFLTVGQVAVLVAVLFIQNPPVNEKVPGDYSSSGGVGMREQGKAATLRYDIVNIGLHFFHKDVRPYAASCSEV
jgi:hypothetical protein